jgi:hypothetical protein
MGRLAKAPWLAVLTIGFLTAACAVAGQDAPNGSGSPAPVAAAPALASPTPTARPAVSSVPGPEFSEARIPKEGTQGVSAENAPVVFEEVGLPGGQVVSYELTGDASASSQCWNPKTAAFGTQNWTITRRVTAGATLTAGGATIRSSFSFGCGSSRGVGPTHRPEDHRIWLEQGKPRIALARQTLFKQPLYERCGRQP